jgi:ligand-binding sensor domain-containing protein/signal transduction histidine kinase
VAGLADAEQMPLRVYTIVDGLAHNEILRIVGDSRGFLWFATSDGLSRFDSHSFTNYTTADGLPHRLVRDVLESRRGEYWVATGGGVCRLNTAATSARHQQSTCTAYKVGESESAQNVFRLLEDRDGVIWVGTFGGVYQLDANANDVRFRFVDFGMPDLTDQRLIQDIIQDRAGSLWVATRGSGLYRRLPDGRVEHYSVEHGVPNRVNALIEDRNGSVWAATANGGLLRFDVDSETNKLFIREAYTAPQTLPSNWVTRLFQSSDGQLWAATNRGLTRFAVRDGVTTVARFTTANGLIAPEQSALAEDADGNLWIGTLGRGAMKMARNGFVTFGKSDGLGIPAIGSISEDVAGDLYLFADGILNWRSGNRFAHVRPKFPDTVTGFSWSRGQVAFQDRFGEWWFATNQGLYRFPKVTRVDDLARTQPRAVYTKKEGLSGDVIYRVFGDSRDDIWINSFSDRETHLTRWERSSQRLLEQAAADGWVPDTWVNAFAEDRSGNLWLATSGKGLARYRAGRFQVFTAADGLRTNDVRDLHVDRQGRLWIGLDEGVDVLDDPANVNPHFRHYGLAEGLMSSETIALTEDLWGSMYIVSGKGVDRLDPLTGHVEHYSAADGLTYERGLAYRDRDGALWFGSNSELSRFVPEPTRPAPSTPLFISAFRIAGVEQPVPMLGTADVSKVVLQPSQNHVAIDYFGLMFRTGETLRYQYWLEGADREWSLPTDQRTVTYPNLAPGEYRFFVRVAGPASAAPAAVAFTILPPIWMRWWFLLLAAATGALLILAFHRYRMLQLVKLHRMRMRIATDLHDDIGASLSRVAIMSEVVKRQIGDHSQESASMLGQIADSARDVVGSMRDIVWAIDPRRDNLDELLARVRVFAASVLEAQGIQWQLEAPVEIGRVSLDPEQRRQIFLFFKEAIHNIARHSGCRSASAVIEWSDGHLISRVRDDGRGLPLHVSQPGSLDGLGLSSLHARANQVGGRLTVETLSAGGTQLTFTVPLKRQ